MYPGTVSTLAPVIRTLHWFCMAARAGVIIWYNICAKETSPERFRYPAKSYLKVVFLPSSNAEIFLMCDDEIREYALHMKI